MLVNIAEGFGQPTDRAFARYLGIGQGSCDELRSHLTIAVIRRCAPADAVAVLQERSHEISRMLNGFSKYLLRCDRRRRPWPDWDWDYRFGSMGLGLPIRIGIGIGIIDSDRDWDSSIRIGIGIGIRIW